MTISEIMIQATLTYKQSLNHVSTIESRFPSKLNSTVESRLNLN